MAHIRQSRPDSGQSGTCKTVKAIFWPWLSDQIPLNLLKDFLFARIGFSVSEQLRRNSKHFRGGLVLKAHRLFNHSTLGSRVINEKKKGSRLAADTGFPLRLREPQVLVQRHFIFNAEQPAPAPHLAHPEGCAALRTVLVTVPRVSRSCEHFPDGFDLHLPKMNVYVELKTLL